MIIFDKKISLINHLAVLRGQSANFSIGFVPTMGFIHQGHAELIQKSIKENDITVTSIFVNPLQFNNIEDYKNYPVDIDKDISFIRTLGCDILFIPEHDEIYSFGHKPQQYELGFLENTLEGFYRPGHFQGVAEVVRILFDIVKPTRAYFGEKDYQQLLVIKKLTELLNLQIKIISYPTVREKDGLAYSSRNSRLNKNLRNEAPFIYEQLKKAKEMAQKHKPLEIKEKIANNFSKNKFIKLEYFEIADANSLKQINEWQQADKAIALVAAYLDNVRLIDNLLIN